jgi:hypothetical protein
MLKGDFSHQNKIFFRVGMGVSAISYSKIDKKGGAISTKP